MWHQGESCLVGRSRGKNSPWEQVTGEFYYTALTLSTGLSFLVYGWHGYENEILDWQ